MLKGIARADEHMTRRASTVWLSSKSNTGAVVFCQPMPIIHCPVVRAFVGLVLAIPLVDLDETLGNTRYMYDSNFCKVSLLSIHLARSLSHPKHGLDIIFFIISWFSKEYTREISENRLGLLYESPQR